jgi:transposase
MFGLTSSTRVFLFAGPTDMRMGFNGLLGLVESKLKEDPTQGHLFVFCNRGHNRIKILFWDGSGLWVCAKRLEKGTFDWPQVGVDHPVLSVQELTWVLEGLSLEKSHRRNWYRRTLK